jgi:hypothetical protein
MEKESKHYTQEEVANLVFNNPEYQRHERFLELIMWEAVYNNDLENYKKALIAGANMYYPDKNGKRVNNIASYLNYHEIAEYYKDAVDLIGGSKWRNKNEAKAELLDQLLNGNFRKIFINDK